MQIERSVLDAIRQHLIAAYPAEGCGFLMGQRQGDDVLVSRRLPVHNHRDADGAEHTRYFISPEDFLSAERTAAVGALQIVGVYHSHPDVSARPSTYDREHAWPWYRYLIISVMSGVVEQECAWELADDRSSFVEHVLRVKEH